MRALSTLGIACLSAWLFFGCASENWDNPKDPESSDFRGPCFGVPSSERAECVFWEAFDHGLSRWKVGESPSGVKPIRFLAAPAGVSDTTELGVPGCPTAGGAGLLVEVPIPNAFTELTVVWMAAPDSKAELSVSLNGSRQIPPSEDGEGEFAGWSVATLTLGSFAGQTLTLGLFNGGEEGATCEDVGVMVSQVHIRALGQ
jgi:hypothetical protein